MTTTVIISVYKDIEALKLILDSLNNQTYKEFEIIISEDCNTVEMKEFISNYKNLNLVHIYQKDIGWRKNIALNNAIRISQGEYLIFLDGDVIPYKNFVEMHVKLAEENKFLTGRRVELGSRISSLIRSNKLSFNLLQRVYVFFIPLLLLDKARHIEEGLYFKPNGFLEHKINSKKKKNMMLLGCNFSCWKKDLLKINGFDEDYLSPTVGEDTDLMWRFNHFNIKFKSVRYIANVFHLYHKRRWSESIVTNNKLKKQKIMNKEYICLNGIEKGENR